MTVVAWDGHTMAADRKASTGAAPYEVTKLFRFTDSAGHICIAGVAGCLRTGLAQIEWLRSGKQGEYPQSKDDEDYSTMLAATLLPTGETRVLRYESKLPAIPLEGRWCVAGSGGAEAGALLESGASAVEAAKVACRLDQDCGLGIDWCSFGGPMMRSEVLLVFAEPKQVEGAA